MMAKLTGREKDALLRLLDGWEPFPAQFEETCRKLKNKDLITLVFDHRMNLVAKLTETGRRQAVALKVGQSLDEG